MDKIELKRRSGPAITQLVQVVNHSIDEGFNDYVVTNVALGTLIDIVGELEA